MEEFHSFFTREKGSSDENSSPWTNSVLGTNRSLKAKKCFVCLETLKTLGKGGGGHAIRVILYSGQYGNFPEKSLPQTAR